MRAPSVFLIETFYPSREPEKAHFCSMKYEDFVSADTQGSRVSARPIPKKHAAAIGGTVCLAAALSFLLPEPSPSAYNTPVLTARQPVLEEHQQPQVQPLISYSADNGAQQTASPAKAAPLEQLKEDVEIMMQPKATLTGLLAAKRPSGYEPTANQNVTVAKQPQDLDNYDDVLPEGALADGDAQLNAEIRKLAAAAGDKEAPAAKWYVEDIERGDTLSSVFSDLNIPYATMQAITSLKEGGRSLTSLRPGDSLSFLIDEDNKLLAFVKQLNKTEQLRFYREDVNKLDFMAVREPVGSHMQDRTDSVESILGGNTTVALAKRPESAAANPADAAAEVPLYQKRGRLVVMEIEKGQAFSTAALQAGLTYGEIDQILRLFQGRIQFSRHIQPGDSMRVLFSDSRGKGKINAVEFNLKRLGKIATYRNLADNKYYDENGYNTSSANFRRFPLNGKVRISSSFNPNRRHPVTGKVRPHNGTDFAVRVGTPVISPADGVVTKAAYSRSAGYYIVIRHRGSYSTVYMHLSKLGVKAGQRVKIGQTIARSGNTGLSTGPHLHYELRRNGKPVNAMRINLPKNVDSAVEKKQRQRFANNVQLYKKELYQESLIAKL